MGGDKYLVTKIYLILLKMRYLVYEKETFGYMHKGIKKEA